MPDQTILKELFIEVSGFTACKLTHTWNGPWKQTALKATNWQRMRKYMGSRAEKQTYRNHFSDQRMLKVLINLFPIGSMVLVYMVTWIPSIYPLYVSIYTSTMDPSWVMTWHGYHRFTEIPWLVPGPVVGFIWTDEATKFLPKLGHPGAVRIVRPWDDVSWLVDFRHHF